MSKKSDSTSRLMVLSNGYGNTPKSCMLVFDSSRYLINSGEGILRLVLSNNLRPSKITNILLTRFDWSCTGGLNGLSKELEDHKHQVILHSNKNFFLDSKQSIKKYFFEKKFLIKQHNHSKSEYSDENVTIKKIDIQKSLCCYLVTVKKSEPNLLMEKLAHFGVKPGPWIRDLKNGIEYNKEGILIKPEDVLDYSLSVEKKIMFIDCTDRDSFDLVRDSTELNRDDLLMMVHLGKSEILNLPAYLQWIKKYPSKDCIHLFLDENYPNIDLIKIYETQAQLNLIDSAMFDYLPAQLDSFKNLKLQCEDKMRVIQKEAKIVQGQSNMIFKIKPDFRLDLNSISSIDNREAKEKILSYYENDLRYKIDGIDEEERKILEKLKLKISNESNSKENHEFSYPNILFLGTASALPATTRNLSSIFVKLNPNVNILLDCGESTIGQLNKKYLDQEEFQNELTKIKLVFISHFHLDHFNGLYGLVINRLKAFKDLNRPYEKLNVMYPRPLGYFLNGSNLVLEDFFNHVNLIFNDKFLAQSQAAHFKHLGLEYVETILVKHIYHSFGINLGIIRPDGTIFKLVYSGDCRPSENLVETGKNCDLLIHECTFDDAFKDEALKKMHSTISEALIISDKMKAKSTILTHFSLRYGKIAQIDDINRNNVGIAFDFMNVSENKFKSLNEILKQVKVIFKEHVDEIEAKRSKKLKL